VAPDPGQHAEMSADVECIDAGDEDNRTGPCVQADGARHVAEGEENAGHRPVGEAGLARTGEIEQTHAGGHGQRRERGGHDECERVHLPPSPIGAMSVKNDSLSIKLLLLCKTNGLLQSQGLIVI